ncbi:hypothetical protein RvY_12075 [Ramazzottius varieornatus]|uniref:Uncharacterized protein n=1 Tax=Ramazzottius varieornatus TaxID=947166 RepID=A0A1D1VNN4_RAMVA|nr:hypothetical protein RvY_12075 [Ramazzottius varieornatus]
METTDSHDTDFIQYRQHLAEVQWLPLWQRRLEGILINAYENRAGVFAGGSRIMKKELPGRSRTQSKEFVLAPVSITPSLLHPSRHHAVVLRLHRDELVERPFV